MATRTGGAPARGSGCRFLAQKTTSFLYVIIVGILLSLIQPTAANSVNFPTLAGSKVGKRFVLNFTLPSTGVAGTPGDNYVLMTVYGGDFSLGDRKVTFDDSLPAGDNTFQFDTLSVMASSLPTGIQSVGMQSGNELVDIPHGTFVYGVLYINTVAVGGEFFFEADYETAPPELRAPLSNAGVAVKFTLMFRLPENANPGSVYLTIYPVDSSADSNGPRVIRLASSIYETGVHSISFDALSTLESSSSLVDSIDVKANLVSEARYNFGLTYQDAYDNTPVQVNSTNVYHDTSTLPVTVIAPAGPRVPTVFTFKYTLQEKALNRTVKLTISQTGAKDEDCPADPNAVGYCPDDNTGDRVVVLATSMESAGTHEFTVPAQGLDSLASLSSIFSVTPPIDLVHGQQYMFTFVYRDYAGNAEPVPANTRIIIFDSETIGPTLSSPICGQRVSPKFNLEFKVEETAGSGTVILNFTRLGGLSEQGRASEADPHHSRAVTFSSLFEVRGTHSVAMTNFSMLAASSQYVHAVAPSQDLVNEAVYGISLCYQDEALNLKGCTASLYDACNVTFDSATMLPVLSSPAENSSIPATFDLNFTLPEVMTPGTCQLTVTETGGVADPVPNPRVVTFTSSVSAAGDYHFRFENTHFQAGAAFIDSVETPFGLNDGTVYSFAISCQDIVSNPPGISVNRGVGYAGVATIAPELTSPGESGCVTTGDTVSFTLIERATPGTVTLTISPQISCSGVTDAAGSRVITFSDTVFEAGSFSFTLSSPSLLVSSSALIDAISSTSAFIDSVQYTFTLSYEDAAGNDAAVDTKTAIAFTGTATLAPTLTFPSDANAIGRAFAINFTLPERALPGSIKLRFRYDSGFSDTYGDRVITFSNEVEDCGVHYIFIGGDGLLTASQISAIASMSPAVDEGTYDLIDGSTYAVSLEYRDCANHTAVASATHMVTYAGITTLAPTLIRPGTRSSIPTQFFIEFVLPEAPCPTSKVKVRFLKSGGVVRDDTNEREIYLNVLTRGHHIFNLSSLSVAAQLDHVHSVVPATNLVHGAKYLVDLFYQDAVCNPEKTSGSIEVSFASNFTLTPLLYFPASSTVIGQSFKVRLSFLEAGKENTTRFTLVPLTPDSSPPPAVCGYGSTDASNHSIVLSDFSEGTQEFFTPDSYLSSASSQSEDIQTIVQDNELVDGTCYNVILSYQDGAGNPESSTTHELIRYAGNTSIPLSPFQPGSNKRVKEKFSFVYSLPEPAQEGALKLAISRVGGANDTNGDRTVSFKGDALFAGPHTIVFRSLETITQDVNVESCALPNLQACVNLVHDVFYRFTLSYRDAVGNAPQDVAQTNLRFDTATGVPTFTLPATSSYIPEPFELRFELPEPALSGSVQLEIKAETGNIIDDSVESRVVVFSSAFEAGPEFGTTMHSLQIGELQGLVSAENVSLVTPSTNLVDGAYYTFEFSYQDDAANARATVQHTGVVFAHNKTITPVLSSPTASKSYTETKFVNIYLWEAALSSSVKLTIKFSHTGRWATAADNNGDRVLTFVSGFETSGAHSCTLSALSGTLPSCISQINTATDLVHGCIYDFQLSYQDFVGNPIGSTTNSVVEHDVATEEPVFVLPSKDRIKVAFALEFRLPENATAGTVKIKIDTLTQTQDPVSTRTIVFDANVAYETTYTFLMTNLSIASVNVTGIQSVSPAVDLVHGVRYVMTIEYRDYLANAKVSTFSPESVITFDTYTEAVIVSAPPGQYTFKERFILSFSLPEDASAGTVKLLLTRTGGADDNSGDREITFTIVSAGSHTVEMSALSNITSQNAQVSNVITPQNLVHHCVYQMRFTYQDYASNTAADFVLNDMKFDSYTETPTILSPSTGDFIPENFTLSFRLPEEALQGSVVLTISYASSTLTKNEPDNRVITFNSSTVYAAGNYSLVVPRLSSLASSVDMVATVSPASDLVDGTVYSFTLEYRDKANNVPATIVSNTVGFSGRETITPVVNSPTSDSSIPKQWNVDLVFYESMSDCNITIESTPVPPVVTEPTFYRVIRFSTSVINAGAHQYDIYSLSTLVSRNSDFDSVSPPDNLVVGALYAVTLVCTDAVGNPAAAVRRANIEFAGNKTLLPYFVEPYPLQSIKEVFTVNFTLPESAQSGSVKLLIIPYNTEVGVPDNNGVRTITFSALFESAGSHTGPMQRISILTDLQHIAGVTPSTDLIDGAIYTFSLEYVDSVGNPKAVVNHTIVTFAGKDTIAPILFLPSANSFIPIKFYFDFELKERALPGTVKIKFERIGLADDPRAAREIIFSSEFEPAGRHSLLMNHFDTVNGTTHPQIQSISNGNLNDGTLYSVTIQFQDAAANPISAEVTSTNVLFDSTHPSIVAVFLDYGTGHVAIQWSEILDLTRSPLMVDNVLIRDVGLEHARRIYLSNRSSENYINLGNATYNNSVDGIFINYTLVEADRALAIAISGTQGGDQGAAILDAYGGTVQDLASNENYGNTITVTETPDSIMPNILSANVDYDTGTIVITADETLDSTPSDKVDPAKIRLANVDGNIADSVVITGGDVVSFDVPTVTITMSELQRSLAIAISGTPGGDGGAAFLNVDKGAVVDIAQNENNMTVGITVTETKDFRRPNVTAASLYLGTGEVVLTLDEIIDVSPSSLVNLSFAHIENVTGDVSLVLSGATVNDTDAALLKLTLTEPQRVRAIELSGTPGGDGAGTVLSVKSAFVQDIGTNPSMPTQGIVITEIPDTILPTLQSVIIDYNEGRVNITASETIDTTPVTKVNLSALYVGDALYSKEVHFPGATVYVANDAYSVFIQLNESQRADALRVSSVPGGDGTAVVLQGNAMAVLDIAGNFNPFAAGGLNAVEIPDTSRPFAVSAEIFYGTGVVKLVANETLDLSPALDNTNLDRFFLASTASLLDIPLAGSPNLPLGFHTRAAHATVGDGDSLEMTIQLTESQRVAAILTSATPGGDQSKVYFHVLAGGYVDVGQNNNTQDMSIPITEHEDNIAPFVIGAHVNLDIGRVIIEASETLELTPSNISLALGNLRLGNGSNTSDHVSLQGAISVVQADAVNITVYLNEVQRVRAIQISGESGGDGSGMVLDLQGEAFRDLSNNTNVLAFNNNVAETPDTTVPTIIGVTLNYSTGILVVTGSETIDALPTTLVDLLKLSVENNSQTETVPLSGNLGVATVEPSERLLVTIKLEELQRITALKESGTRGGDGIAARFNAASQGFQDIAQNKMPSQNIVITEYDDVIIPVVNSAALNYSTGVLTITSSEYIDVIPASNVNLDNIYISDSSSSNDIQLTGATVTEVDGYTITLTLTELQRSLAIALSNTPGGNGGAVVLDVYSGALRDHGENHNIDNLGIVVTEVNDTVVPKLTLGHINFGTGLMTIKASETIDVTPHSQVDFSKMFLSNSSGDKLVSLDGSKVVSVDHTEFNFTVPELARVQAISISGTPGGDGQAVVLDVMVGAVHDVAQNLNLAQSNLVISETPDTIPPNIVNCSLNYSTGMLVIFTDETIDTTPGTLVNLSKVFLSQSTGDHNIALAHSTVVPGDDLAVTIMIPPVERANAIALSGTSGGDGGGIRLDVLNGAFADIGEIAVLNTPDVRVFEEDDIVPPEILHVNLSFGTGTLVINSDEVLDFSPISQVDLAKLFLSDTPKDQAIAFNQGAAIVESDGLQTTIILTELQRVAAIAFSATPGGNGGSVTMDALSEAVQDVAYNGNMHQDGITVYEVKDAIKPIILNGTLNYSTGILRLRASEILDLTPFAKVNLNSILIVNNTGDANLALTGANFTTSDDYQITIQLTEYQRARSVEKSSTPGGDGVPVVVDARQGALADIGENTHVDTFDVFIVETPDTIRPLPIAVHINYENGIVKITADESIDVNGTSPLMGTIDVSKLILSEEGSTNTGFNLTGATTAGLQTPDFFVQLTELQRVEGIKISGTQGGDGDPAALSVLGEAMNDLSGNPSFEVLNITMTETRDARQPNILTATLDLNDGTMVITADETLRVANPFLGTTLTNTSLIFAENKTFDSGLNRVSLGQATVTHAESQTITIKLHESERALAIPFSGMAGGTYDPNRFLNADGDTYGGDGNAMLMRFDVGALFDMGINPNALSPNIVVTEIPDTTQPEILYAQINYGLGLVRMICSETIDVTPPSLVNLSQIYVVDETGDRSLPNAILLDGASINITNDSPIVTIKMTETQRVNAIMISGTPGGDDTPARLDVASPTVRDIAGLTNRVDILFNLTIFELPDLIRPSILNAFVNYNTGAVSIFCNEQVPDGGVYIGNMSIADNRFGNISDFSLGGDVRYGNAMQFMQGEINLLSKNFDFVNITLTEVQRVGAIKLSNTPGGDGTPAFLVLFAGAINDVSSNPNNIYPPLHEGAASLFVLNEIGDATKPTVQYATIDMGTGKIVLNCTETIDQTPKTNVRFESFSIRNDSLGLQMVNISSTGTYEEKNSNTNIYNDSLALTFTLSEAQRSIVLRWAGTTGGDGSAVNLHVVSNAFFDVALNRNEEIAGLTFIEILDIIPPNIVSCALSLGDGKVVFVLDEHVPTVPATIVNVSMLYFANASATNETVDRTLPLSGSEVFEENDVLSVTMTIPESTRIASIRGSGTPGGDGKSLFLESISGAFQDISSNAQTANTNMTINETADTIKPTVQACYIDYNDGTVIITMSEHVNAGGFTGVSNLAIPGVFLSKIRLSNSTNETRIEFAGESLAMSEGYNVTFVLNEYKRVGALRISDTPGGDLSPVILEIDEGGIVDVATNKIDDLTSFPVFETPDTTVPRITHAAVKLTDGTVHLTFSEIIDQTPSSDVNLDRLVFRDITASGNPGVGVPLSGATIYSSDEVYINISMTEAQRVAVIAISGTSGGNGSAVILDVAAGAVKDIAGQ